MSEIIIDGKPYTEYGPLYCPEGTRWEWLYRSIQDMRRAGQSVRVRKYPIGQKDQAIMFHNTHRVFIYTRPAGVPA